MGEKIRAIECLEKSIEIAKNEYGPSNEKIGEILSDYGQFC